MKYNCVKRAVKIKLIMLEFENIPLVPLQPDSVQQEK